MFLLLDFCVFMQHWHKQCIYIMYSDWKPLRAIYSCKHDFLNIGYFLPKIQFWFPHVWTVFLMNVRKLHISLSDFISAMKSQIYFVRSNNLMKSSRTAASLIHAIAEMNEFNKSAPPCHVPIPCTIRSRHCSFRQQ